MEKRNNRTDAAATTLDVTEFDGNLSAADDTVQKALETLDEVAPGSATAATTSTDTANFDNNLSAADDTVQKALETLDEVAGSGTDDQNATEVPYTPTDGTDWADPDPTEVGGALDDIAVRVTINEDHVSGDGTDHSTVSANSSHRIGSGSDHANVATNTTHTTGDGSDHANVATNTAHATGDGSDHQDVADLVALSGVVANATDLGTFTGTTIPDTQTTKQALQALETAVEAGSGTDDQNATEVPYTPTDGTDWADPDPTEVGGALDDIAVRVTVNEDHVSGDGTDHSTVSANSSHRIGSGSDHANVATNTTHTTSNGTDHTYIDQDVTIGSAPTFTADNLSDGGSNAIITTTQETNFESAYTHSGVTSGNPHSVTKTEVSLGNVTDDAQLKRAADDFVSFAQKTAVVGADIVLLEDSEAAGVKKYANVEDLLTTVGTSQTVHVDGARTDSYTESGTVLHPYKAIDTALASITDAAADKRYAVVCADYEYTEAINLKAYVEVVGTTRKGTILNINSDAVDVEAGSVNTGLRNLTIYGDDATFTNMIDINGGTDLVFQGLDLIYSGAETSSISAISVNTPSRVFIDDVYIDIEKTASSTGDLNGIRVWDSGCECHISNFHIKLTDASNGSARRAIAVDAADFVQVSNGFVEIDTPSYVTSNNDYYVGGVVVRYNHGLNQQANISNVHFKMHLTAASSGGRYYGIYCHSDPSDDGLTTSVGCHYDVKYTGAGGTGAGYAFYVSKDDDLRSCGDFFDVDEIQNITDDPYDGVGDVYYGSMDALGNFTASGSVAVGPDATDKVTISHDGTNATYVAASGGHKFTGVDYMRIGTGTTSQSLDSDDDLLVTGELEVDGTSWFDGLVNTYGSLVANTGNIQLLDDVELFLGAGSDAAFVWSTGATNDQLRIGVAGNMAVSLMDKADIATATDFNSVTPKLLLHGTDHTKYGELGHDNSNLNIAADTGSVVIDDEYLTSGLAFSQTGTTGLVGFAAGTTSVVAALNELKLTKVTDVTGATHTVVLSDEIVHVEYTDTGAVSITIDDDNLVSGRHFRIKDAGGQASLNNISIYTEGSALIDGQSSVTINGNYDALVIYSDGAAYWMS